MAAGNNVIDLPWRARLRKSEKGKTLGDEANTKIALEYSPDLAGLVRLNEFSLQIELTRAPPWRKSRAHDRWSDNDDVELMMWLQHIGISMRSRNATHECLSVVAQGASFHPVKDYLAALEWDATQRLNEWLVRYLGAKGNEAYLAAIGRKFLVSAVARILSPGCQADHTIVLEGRQGGGKSRAARTLAIMPEWFTDRLPDLHSADAAIQLAGRWIIELSELAALKRTDDIETSKGYLSRTFDVYRPPYGRSSIHVPRQCVFIGSTNEQDYLRDRTGNRRYWPVKCGDLDIEYLTRDRDQLWAEAMAAFKCGEQWHLESDEGEMAAAEQDERVQLTELEERVMDYLERNELSGMKETTTREVFINGLGLDPDKPDYIERAGRIGNQVVVAMRRAGWEKVAAIGRGKARRNVFRKAQGTPV